VLSFGRYSRSATNREAGAQENRRDSDRAGNSEKREDGIGGQAGFDGIDLDAAESDVFGGFWL
jgi:hypothetical protein